MFYEQLKKTKYAAVKIKRKTMVWMSTLPEVQQKELETLSPACSRLPFKNKTEKVITDMETGGWR